MPGISFIISTKNENFLSLEQIVKNINSLNIPEYEIVVIGGHDSILQHKNVVHIPWDNDNPYICIKKNTGVKNSKYESLVIMHDYHLFDSNWYQEFEKFGSDWDVCIHQVLTLDSQGSQRANGWRVTEIPNYPEIPFAMTIPWDIDCFIPYMVIPGSYWVAKKAFMLKYPLNENLKYGECEDVEWSTRIVPGWGGTNCETPVGKIIANPNCIVRFNKFKQPYPGNPNWQLMENNLEFLWKSLREGNRRHGTFYFERSLNKVVRQNNIFLGL